MGFLDKLTFWCTLVIVAELFFFNAPAWHVVAAVWALLVFLFGLAHLNKRHPRFMCWEYSISTEVKDGMVHYKESKCRRVYTDMTRGPWIRVDSRLDFPPQPFDTFIGKVNAAGFKSA